MIAARLEEEVSACRSMKEEWANKDNDKGWETERRGHMRRIGGKGKRGETK